MINSIARRSASALAFAAVTGSAFAGTPHVIFSNIQTSPTSIVPDTGGLERFKTGATTQFDRMFLSPNGRHWIIRALANTATTSDELVITGQWAESMGASLRAREGSPTGFDGSINFGIIRQQMGINDSGQYAFSADTTAATTMDDVVVRGLGVGQALLAREGDTIPGSGDLFGSANDSVHILNNGTVRFRSGALQNAVGDDALVEMSAPATGSMLARTNVFTPTGQLVPPAQVADIFTANSFRSNHDGSLYILGVDMLGPTTSDYVTVVNGAVVGQEGVVLPFSTFSSNVTSMDTASGTRTIAGSSFCFRGSNVDTIDWVFSDNAVRAVTDTPIHVGAVELWDDTSFAANFFSNSVNSLGDYAIGGTTNNPDSLKNAVVVFNNRYLIARESDPVDVDGDRMYNDNAFISVFNNDDAVLTRDGKYYFMADLKDAANAAIGQAFMVEQIGTQPFHVGVVSGTLLGGDHMSVEFSDDNRLILVNDEFDSTGEIQYHMEGEVDTAAAMRFMMETSATRNDIGQYTDMFNFVTQQWQQVHFKTTTLSDVLDDYTVTNVNAFIESGSRHMIGRMRWVPTGDIDAADGWSQRVDLFSIVPMQ